MFRRDFMASLFSLLPVPWVLRQRSAFGPIDPGLVTKCNVSLVTHFFNYDFSLAYIKMEGWFKVVGGPSAINAISLKVRDEALSGQSCNSPIPSPVSGTRHISLDLRVSPDSNTVHWNAVDQEPFPGLKVSTPNP